jgi:hypothetical protein
MNPFSLEHITSAPGYAIAAAGDADATAAAAAANAAVADAIEIAPAEDIATTAAQYSLDNIANADGYAIALSGLAIVFFALVVVTLFISILPRVLARLATVWPEEAAPASVAASAADDGVIAAIGYMMHARQQGGSDR